MIKCGDWPIGVCTWSLGNNLDEIADLSDETGVESLHLSLAPVLDGQGGKYLQRIEKHGWRVSATMVGFPQEDYSTLESIRITGGIVPDESWPDNKRRVLEAIDITAELSVKYLEFHFGFISVDDAEHYKKLSDRVCLLAERARERGVVLLMETGQETTEELSRFIEAVAHPALAVNFDPANMLLYDKDDPVGAVKTLAKHIRHFHAKDAVRAAKQGDWGREVPWGQGMVNPEKFLSAMKKIGFEGSLAIEREAGNARMEDIKLAIENLRRFSVDE